MVNLDYLYNPAAAKPYFDKNYFVDKKLGFQTVENGMILPYKPFVTGVWNWGGGGVVDGTDKYIKGTYIKSEINGAYTPPRESISHRAETVIYIGTFINVWGHFITDCARRLWFLKSEFMKEFQNCLVVYIDHGNPKFSDQYQRLLEILGVNFDKFQLITQPTRFDKIILPDESFYFDKGKKFTAEYRETINCVKNFALKNRTPISNKKIYYLHAMRNQIGEERLAEYFEAKGYDIIRPEKLTLEEQLNLLINAESFVSTVGSISHNSLFLRDGTETILIPRSTTRFNPPLDYQTFIDSVFSMNTKYIDSTLSLFYSSNHNYCYIISPQLKRFFGDRFNGYEEEDFKIFLKYVKNSIISGKTINTKELVGYGAVFQDFMDQLKQHENLITACDMPPNWEKFQPAPFSYQTHIGGKGWGAWLDENSISNDIEQKRQIEAVKIHHPMHKVYYSVYFNDKEGWTEEVSTGQMAGTTGKGKPIMGIRIRLDEAGTKKFDILYRVHKFDGTWTDWAKNGEVIYSHGQKLNAVQIKLETKT